MSLQVVQDITNMSLGHNGLESVLSETIKMVCKNGITYSQGLKLQGLLGVTVDGGEVILVQFNEEFGYTNSCPNLSPEIPSTAVTTSVEKSLIISKDHEFLDFEKTISPTPSPKSNVAKRRHDTVSTTNNSDSMVPSKSKKSRSQFQDRDLEAACMSTKETLKESGISAESVSSPQETFPIMMLETRPQKQDGDAKDGSLDPARLSNKRPCRETNVFSESVSSPQETFPIVKLEIPNIVEQHSSPEVHESMFPCTLPVDVPQSYFNKEQQYMSPEFSCNSAVMESFHHNPIISSTSATQATAGCSQYFETKVPHDFSTSTSPDDTLLPLNRLQNRAMKDALEQYIIAPLVLGQLDVVAVRLVWRNRDRSMLDDAWKQLAMRRESCDAAVCKVPGVKFFFTAVTGTYTKNEPKETRMVYPGVSYWIVMEPGGSLEAKYSTVSAVLHSSVQGVEIKHVSFQNKDKAKSALDVIASTLFVVLKDHSSKYMTIKLQESGRACNRQNTGTSAKICVVDAIYMEAVCMSLTHLERIAHTGLDIIGPQPTPLP